MHTQEVSKFYFSTVGSLLIVFIFCLSMYTCIGGRAFSRAHFGAGSGQIFLDDVQCTSSSSQLLECPSRPILSHNCLHSADAGVGCEGNLVFKKNYQIMHGWKFYFSNLTNLHHIAAAIFA